ncbi:lipoprotein insertase outer membrane protein LolB [Roseateles sp. DB2]|uniref:lipoprotein insertase outer membrane protein LolB n=1 Tax=Roseateles sp. DB2 TaxID=3453717 RepID=UPI003EEDE944
MRTSLLHPARCSALLLLAALSACAHGPRQAQDQPPRELAAPADNVPAPLFSGKLSVQVPPLPGQRLAQGGSGSFELLGDATQGQLELSTPTGSLLARVRWTPTSVSLEQAKDQRSYDSLDALTLELLGESVPVAALFDWLQGRPWAGAAANTLPAPALGFEQLGWRVETDRLAEGLLLARQLGGRSATLRLRLARQD